jgi:TonB-linked SusC/RagA family outer membrane protein
MRTMMGQRLPCSSLIAACLTSMALHLVGATGVQAQTGTIVGQVTDPRSGEGIGAAALQVEGTRFGTVSGVDGRYRITGVTAGAHVVIARRLGYTQQRQTVTVADREVTANFILQVNAVALDQVVVTGTAGGEAKRSIGNVVSTIDATAELSKSSAPNLSSLLSARAPGLVISPATSRLGAGPSIQIRGRTSISLDNSPLLYIDGVRVSNATASGPIGVSGGGSSFGAQNSNVGGRLNDISPEDIQSIEVIKGPAAATIYGTEAANGVIQIITKKGAAGVKPQFSMQVQTGSLSFRDAAGRVPTNYLKDASGNVVTWNGVQQEADSGRPIFKTGQTRLYNASLQGGREQAQYYISVGYENDLGIEPNNSLRQFTLHANLNSAITSRTEFASSVNFTNVSAHLGADVGVSALLGAEVGHRLLFPASRGFYPNFPPEIPQGLYDNSQGINRFTGSGTLSNRPTDWFSHRAIVGIDYTGDDSRALEQFAPPSLASFLPPTAAGGRIGQTLRHNSIITADYSGTAKFNLTSAMSSASSIGGQFYRTELNISSLGGYGFPAQGVATVSAAANTVLPGQGDTINTTVGAYAQQTFGWRERLFLTGAVRVDNNSAFGNDFKWVTYPKVSASWVVNEEPFWHTNNVVNTLRLRSAYGESGRQPAAFTALRTFTPVQGPGSSNAVTPGSIGNSNLKPERGKEVEVGLESGLFNRLTIDFTYFSKQTRDEIINQPVAPSSGFSGNQFVNLGRVDNHGIELQANLQALTRNSFGWDISASLATNKDVIKDLGGLPSAVTSAGQFNQVGFPIRGIFTRRVVSADRDATTGFATNVLCDGGAGKPAIACAQAPFVFIGTPTPKTTGAITNTFTIAKRLRLYALVDFKRGFRLGNSVEQIRCQGLVGASLCEANYFPQKYSPIYLAEVPGTASALGTIDQFYQDASFVKLREISATYTLPTRQSWGYSRASFTLAARELHTWTDYRGPDPEVTVANVATSGFVQDQAVVPPLMRLIATLNITF